MTTTTASPTPRIIPTLRDTGGTVYTYVGVCEFDGLLCYRFGPDGDTEIYEVTPDEVTEMIARGWWAEVTA